MYYVLPEYPQLCNVSWDCPEVWPDIELVIRFVDRLMELHENVYFKIRGGDATEWKDLPEFLSRVPKGVFVDIEASTTSQKAIYWEKLPPIYNVRFDYRGKGSRVLLTTVGCLVNSHVNLHIEFSKFSKIRKLHKKLLKLGVVTRGVEYCDVTYSDEQREVIESFNNGGRGYPGLVVWEHELVHPAELRRAKVNEFRDWKCRAGSTRFHIDSNNTVHGAKCGVHFAGNLAQLPNLHISTSPLTCPFNTCENLNDLRIEKWSPELPTHRTNQIP